MSGYLLQGVGEEKESRVIEVLLSSVSARQLLTGKVLGLGAAGLLQILIWVLSVWGIINYASATFAAAISISTGMLILAIVYFVLGYLLFAAIFAGVGAIFPTAREGSSWSAIFIMPAALPLWLSGFIIQHPEHVIVRIFTIFPLTSPIMVMMRLGLSEISAWELALSIGVLAISIVIAMCLAAKVFRMGLLMYGKRPSFKEIARAIREA
jgi:ABC-2 type transport system permease protein